MGAQWQRIHWPKQETRIQTLVQEDAAEQLRTRSTTTEPVLESPGATTTEVRVLSSPRSTTREVTPVRAHAPQLEKSPPEVK